MPCFIWKGGFVFVQFCLDNWQQARWMTGVLTKYLDVLHLMFRNHICIPFLFWYLCKFPIFQTINRSGWQLVINRRGAQYPQHRSFSVYFYRRSVVPMKGMILIERKEHNLIVWLFLHLPIRRTGGVDKIRGDQTIQKISEIWRGTIPKLWIPVNFKAKRRRGELWDIQGKTFWRLSQKSSTSTLWARWVRWGCIWHGPFGVLHQL